MSGTNRKLLQTSPSLELEGTEDNRVSSPPFPDLYWKAAQDDNNTPSPRSEVSFWAHTSSVEAYCRHYGKTFEIDPVPKWRLRSLYPNAPTTFSGPTPPKKRRAPEGLSRASARPSHPSKKRRLWEDPEEISSASSPCERKSLR